MHGKRNVFSRLFHAKKDKDAIIIWRQDLNRILHIFNVRLVGLVWQSLRIASQTELLINNHAMLSNIHRLALEGQGGVGGQHHSVSVSFSLPKVECSPFLRLKPGQW